MKRFKKVYLEITNACNLNCSFCPKTKRDLRRTTEKEFLDLIQKIKPYTDYVYLHLLGEPTMHPKLGQYLAICEAYGLKVNLTTNGTLLHKVQKTLLEAPALRQVNISLHSFEANNHQMTMAAYMDHILDFVQAARKQGKVICSLRLWNQDSDTLKAENTLNAAIMEQIEQRLHLDFNIQEALKEKSGIKLAERLYLNQAQKFEWPDRDRDRMGEEVFCYGLRDQIGVLVDGTVVPCCLDGEGHIALGNLFEQSLEEILESPRSKALYDGFSNRCAVEPLCQRCEYATRYQKKP